MIVRLEHLSLVRGFGPRAGFCRRGARAWFKRHRLDWDSFRHRGIDSTVLEATGDALALALVKAAETHERAAARAAGEVAHG